MLFNSLQFILFFFAFFLILFSIPVNFRKYWLLIASCYFYMVFKPIYLLILFTIILIDFFSGKKIEKSQKNKKIWLAVSLVSNIGILVFYKYFNFLNENISSILNLFSIQNPIPLLTIILPIGLSFHTFQAMSYTIEVYRGKQPAEKNILIYSLYVMYFPQLVAGPIERPQNLIHKLKNTISFNTNNILSGLFRISIGLFKKVVIADRLALFTDPVFNDISNSNGLSIFVATIFFAFQIYCDFAGYTDIAIGISKMMGISLMENFKNPYFSTSLSEFWTRWHISLSSWFKDYLYIPLGGNKTKLIRWIFNILIVFFLSGLWHGSRWNFIIWGLLHGLMLIVETTLNKSVKKIIIPSIIKIIITFTFVCFTWIFFRVNNLNDAYTAINKILNLSLSDNLPNIFNYSEFAFSIVLIFMLLFFEKFIKRNSIQNKKTIIIYTLSIFSACYFFGEFYFKQFIYFQF